MARKTEYSQRVELLLYMVNWHENEMTDLDHIQVNDEFGAHNYLPLPVVLAKGRGVWVWDINGKKYLDFLSAYSAVNAGHCNPDIVRAVVKQARKLDVVSRAFLHDEQAQFTAELAEFCKKEMVLLMNTGAEAVETAIKSARLWGYRVKGVPKDQAEIIVMDGNFHGRTTTIVGFSAEPLYKDGFGPFTPGFVRVPYDDIEAVKKAITGNTVGILFEPIQGEAGIKVPHDGYVKAIRELCDRYNILMIADEIQVGLGRTGDKFACDHENVVPDLYILGKALGGGQIPVSAVVGNKDILGLFTPGMHGSTFGAYPPACAAGRAYLHVYKRDMLALRSSDLGEYFMEQLKTLHSPYVKEVRGRGLLIGVELDRPARPFCEQLKELGLLCKETHGNIIRFAPPLTITKEQINWAFKRIRKVLEG